MARLATRARTQTGLYGILWDREESAARNGGRVQQSSGQIYVGSHERLAAFRRGEPVSMRAWDVPEAARGGVAKECPVWRKAIVWPDGEVEICVATGEEVLADLGRRPLCSATQPCWVPHSLNGFRRNWPLDAPSPTAATSRRATTTRWRPRRSASDRQEV
jgi:hypothetical protein